MAAPYLDTVHHVETPEGVILELRPAGPVVRLAAWSVDAALRIVLLGLLAIVLAALGKVGAGVFFLTLFAVNWLTPVAFELLWNGATPGKRLLGLQVVRDNGLPVDAAASLIRNLLRAADALPLLFLAALVTMLATRGFRRLGDLAAGTLVVYGPHGAQQGLWQAASSRALEPVAPSVALTTAEQKTIVRFAERAPFLGEARARELAEPVAALVDRRPGARSDPVGSLAGLAAWITGERGATA